MLSHAHPLFTPFERPFADHALAADFDTPHDDPRLRDIDLAAFMNRGGYGDGGSNNNAPAQSVSGDAGTPPPAAGAPTNPGAASGPDLSTLQTLAALLPSAADGLSHHFDITSNPPDTSAPPDTTGVLKPVNDGGGAFAQSQSFTVSNSAVQENVTLNSLNNNTIATVSYNDGAGHSDSFQTYLSQFSVTFNDSLGGSTRIDNTFCLDLAFSVSLGQNYRVNSRNDLASPVSGWKNGSRIAYIYQNFGTDDLRGNAGTTDAVQAAAVQLAIWDLSFNNHNPLSFTKDTGTTSTYSSGDDVFKVVFGNNPNAAEIAAKTNDYLIKSINATTVGAWLDAAANGTDHNRGQSLLLPPAVTGSIEGISFDDKNGNGLRDVDDPVLPGWTIDLDKNADGTVEASAITDVDGKYQFNNLVPGMYRVREVLQPNWAQTGPNPLDIILVARQNSQVNFGNIRIDLDLQAFRPQTAPFKPVPVPTNEEVGIRVNGDDDNGQGVPDASERGVRNEDDLVRLLLIPAQFAQRHHDVNGLKKAGRMCENVAQIAQLSVISINPGPAPAGVEYVLKRENINIDLWRTPDKHGDIFGTAKEVKIVTTDDPFTDSCAMKFKLCLT